MEKYNGKFRPHFRAIIFILEKLDENGIGTLIPKKTIENFRKSFIKLVKDTVEACKELEKNEQ